MVNMLIILICQHVFFLTVPYLICNFHILLLCFSELEICLTQQSLSLLNPTVGSGKVEHIMCAKVDTIPRDPLCTGVLTNQLL